MIEDNLLVGRDLHKPTNCDKCGGNMRYNGVGEYQCEKCGFFMYDDYGKVRNYLETHKGATQGQVSAATGVSVNTIRQFLRDDRIEVTANSAILLSCESCGTSIRSGRFCDACQAKRGQSMIQAKAQASPKKSVQGFGMASNGSTGAKRFSR